MELSQIKTFTVVAKTLHFTRAAEELKLTQPAVSHQIKSLEIELGKKLFVRDKQKISLTSEGKLFWQHAKRMLAQVRAMRQEIKDHRTAVRGTVKLTAITRSLANPFHELLKIWRELNNEIELSFDSATFSESIIEKVRNGEADIGFSTLTDEFEGLESIPWGYFHMGLAAGSEHPIANTVTFEELQNEKWILFDKGSWLRRESDAIFDKYNFSPGGIYECNDGTVVRNLIKEGFGISLMPVWGIFEELSAGNIRIVKIENIKLDLPVRLIVRETGRARIVDIFLDFLFDKKLEDFLPPKFKIMKT